MSTRVQKGGPIFKPTPKPRLQPTASASVVAQESLTTTTAAAVTAARSSTQPSQSLVATPSYAPPLAISSPVLPNFTPVPSSDVRHPSTVEYPTISTVPQVQSTSSKTAKKPRKSKAPSLVPLDPAADPGENIDPTLVTMAALCNDTGQGRVSSKAALVQNNHAAWRASNKERRARMKVVMEAKKFGRNEEAECSTRNTNSTIETGVNSAPVVPTNSISTAPISNGQDGPSAQDESDHGFDYSQTLATSRFNVQIRIGPNGETIVDEESLFVDRNDEENTDNYMHVEESDNTKFINSGSFGKKYRGSRWSAEETELFYDAVSQFGENYELISYVLPGRDRKSCKNKFKAEDKKNTERITYCLNNRIPYDMQTLSRMTGKDFSGPIPVIRAPNPLTLDQSESSEMSGQLQKQCDSLPMGDMHEEIVGDAESFDP